MIPPFSRSAAEYGSFILPWVVGFLWTTSLFPTVVGKYTPYLEQGFFFDWTPPDQSPPIPTTAQCDTIHITYNRGNAVGPNPVAPYYLQVYTSTFIVPFVIEAGTSNGDLSFDWPVPFIPGTQYEICMFDSNGVTGGCQAIYTVYPAANTTFANPPVCTNLSYPHPDQVLGVTALVDNGPLGEYAWIPTCTDISVKPTNGTPPYTLTVAPALRPPYNITSNTTDAITWTVSLSWGSPFFISLADSSGMSWAFGPLHSAQGNDTTCLTELPPSPPSSSKEVKPWVAAVSGVGGLLVGVIAGLLGAFVLLNRRQRRRSSLGRPDALHRKSSSMSITTPVLSHPHERYSDLPTPPGEAGLHMRDSSYHIEPFVLPADHELGARSSATTSPANTLFDRHTQSTSLTGTIDRSRSPEASVFSQPATSPAASAAPGPLPFPPRRALTPESRSGSQVFVVHHDGGRPPVTVYAADGTEIVELPPRYIDSGSSAGPSSDPSVPSDTRSETTAPPPIPLQERRQVGATPTKLRRTAS